MNARTRKAVRLSPATDSAAVERQIPAAVFTSVDGTLLDPVTFEAGPSRNAVARLRALGIPVIPSTVMTLDEMLPVVEQLGPFPLMILEAGGAIARFDGTEWHVEGCGPDAATMLDVVAEIEQRADADLIVYSALSEQEAALVSARRGRMLEGSLHRCFSEPFLLESGDLDAVRAAAAHLGFSVRTGRRFLHLCRSCDEGFAFERVRNELQCQTTIAIGSAPVDADFLSRADVPIVIPGSDGRPSAELLERVPHARVVRQPGPNGWADAVAPWLNGTEAGARRDIVGRGA